MDRQPKRFKLKLHRWRNNICLLEVIVSLPGQRAITGLILGLRPANEERSLQSNAVFHWLGANLESALHYIHNLESLTLSQGHCRTHSSWVRIPSMYYRLGRPGPWVQWAGSRHHRSRWRSDPGLGRVGCRRLSHGLAAGTYCNWLRTK